MATIAVGDIHGNLRALDDLLGQLRREVTTGDTVVFLGDCIDRGPDSKGCIDAILGLQAEGPARVIALCGNHEEWFLRTLRDPTSHSWLFAMSGLATIRSYSTEAADLIVETITRAGPRIFTDEVPLPYRAFFDAIPPAHLSFLTTLALCHRGPDGLCVHGGLDPGIARLEDQPEERLIWGAKMFPDGYAGAELVVYGHADNADLDANGWPHPHIAGATIGIDTISHGVLTAVRLTDRRVFQSARYGAGE